MSWYEKLWGGSSAVPDGLQMGSATSTVGNVFGSPFNGDPFTSGNPPTQSTHLGGIWGLRSQALSTADPNTMPEMQLSLEDAHALWVAKFGTEWVPIPNVDATDGFNWMLVANRLQRIDLLEYDGFMGYYKIIPLSLWK